jgi:uncharacterized ferritin-like protein (DUF455 family)
MMILLALYLLYRIAIINLTHEAKGLDTYEKTREKFLNCKDKRSISILDHNYREEIGHVALGLKWFKYIAENRKFSTSNISSSSSSCCCCSNSSTSTCIDYFHQLSRRYFKGKLKEPFNHIARYQAGLTKEWYLPLAK